MQRFIGNLIAASIFITWLVVGSSVFASIQVITIFQHTVGLKSDVRQPDWDFMLASSPDWGDADKATCADGITGISVKYDAKAGEDYNHSVAMWDSNGEIYDAGEKRIIQDYPLYDPQRDPSYVVAYKMNKIVPTGRTNIWVTIYCQVELEAYTSAGTPLEVIPFGLPSNKAVRTRVVLNAPYGDTELRFKGVVDETYTFSVKINSDIPKVPYFEVRDHISIKAGEFQKFIVHSDGTLESGDLQPFYHGKANPAFDPTLIGFITPTSDVTNVQTGSRELRIHLMYSARITDGFSASLNGVDVSDLFHPIPGKSEVVTLYAYLGSNITSTLSLYINGIKNGKQVKYRSTLDFITTCTR